MSDRASRLAAQSEFAESKLAGNPDEVALEHALSMYQLRSPLSLAQPSFDRAKKDALLELLAEDHELYEERREEILSADEARQNIVDSEGF